MKYKQIIPAQPGWVSVWENDGRRWCADVALWAIQMHDDGEECMVGFSSGDFADPDDEYRDFVAWMPKEEYLKKYADALAL